MAQTFTELEYAKRIAYDLAERTNEAFSVFEREDGWLVDETTNYSFAIRAGTAREYYRAEAVTW